MKQYVKPPMGAVPDGTKAGDEFDLVTTYEMESDGRCCIKRMGDTQMDYDKKEKSKPDYSEYSKGMSDQMTMAQPEGGMA